MCVLLGEERAGINRLNTLENFFCTVQGCSWRKNHPRGSVVKIWGKRERKNHPSVPWSNIAGSWTRGGTTISPTTTIGCTLFCVSLEAMVHQVLDGGAFFNWSHFVPCALPDTLVLRCMMFVYCVKVAPLAKRAFMTCFAS